MSRDKRQTNICAAPSNPDQSVCQGTDKLTVRRGQREVEGVSCDRVDVRLSTLEGAFTPSASVVMDVMAYHRKFLY